ncbi:MAG: cytochrome b/b6 domain-containing protein [Pseudobdellovibrionaceae bacterium]
MNKYTFKKYQPLGLRIWHWVNALTIFGLLGTVFLRKTFLSTRDNATLIENKLHEAGTQVTPEVAKGIAASIRNLMWDWHFVLGFVLAGALVVRILVALFIEKKCPATNALQSLKNIKKVSTTEKSEAFHFAAVKVSHAVFYFGTLAMAVTGLTMYFRKSLNLSKETLEPIQEFHEFMMWFFIAFVIAHIIGIIRAENRHDAGLVSDMINGGKK